MMKYYKTLKEMTGRTEGYLLYPDGTAVWFDWSYYDGVPGKTVQPFQGDKEPDQMEGIELLDLLEGRVVRNRGKYIIVDPHDQVKRWMVLPYILHEFDLLEDHMVEVFVVE